MPKTSRHSGGSNAAIVTYPSRQPIPQPEPEPASEPEQQTETGGYDARTNDQLRTELGARGLATSGAKADLVDRLLDDDTAPG